MKVGIDDNEGFQHFKTALRKLEFPRSEIAEICQILASILHLGQLEFVTSTATTPAPHESGGYSHEGGESVTVVKNKNVLDIISAFLGVSASDLEISLGYRAKTIGRERVTVMLDPQGAQDNADELAKTLYSLLVAQIIETINQRVCAPEDSIANTISVVDFPGFAKQSSTGSTLDQLLNNAASESLYNYCLQSFFERQTDMLEAEDISLPPSSYCDNSDAVKCLLKSGNGLLSILDDQMRRGKTDIQFLESIKKRFEGKNRSIAVGNATTTLMGSNFATHNASANFTIKHYSEDVSYEVNGLLESNSEAISGDLMNLMRSTRSDFVRDLFGSEALNTVVHPKERTAVVQASVSSKPMRVPSVARRKGERPLRLGARKTSPIYDDVISEVGSRTSHGRQADVGQQSGAASQFLSSLSNITRSLTSSNANPYIVFCLKPNDRRIANQFDSKCVRSQVQAYNIAEISQRLRSADFSVFLPFGEFLALADSDTVVVGSSERERAEVALEEKRWPSNEAKVGTTGVFLSERCWMSIANLPAVSANGHRHFVPENDGDGADPFLTPQRTHADSKVNLMTSQVSLSPGAYYNDKNSGDYFGSREYDAKSDAGVSAVHEGDMFKNLDTREQLAEKGKEVKMEPVEEHPVSGSRKRWLFIVWTLTFWVPDFMIRFVGRMSRKDIRVAWREKLAINMLIWLSCSFVVFFMIGFPELICPTQHVYSQAELSSFDGKDGHMAYIGIRGVVYDLGAFIPHHYPSIVPASALQKYAGTDATNLFPVQVSAVCNGKTGTIDDAVQLNYKNTNYTSAETLVGNTDLNARYHDFRWATNDSRPDWWWEQQIYLKANYQKGRIGFSPDYLKTLAKKSNSIAILYNRVYDFTAYVKGGRAPQYRPGMERPSEAPDSNFMEQSVIDLFQQRAGDDISKYWEALSLDPELRSRMKVCLDNLFYVGDLDTRNSTQCLFAKYVLLAISILLVSVIGFKFLAALQFGKKNMPENLDKFIICTVPAYTEDEESLRRAIDSAARMRYDDKRKLLVIICDGMIIGQGNDRPTPRIVLDILGVSETVDPEALSFESLGEGMKQHNMGKVYSGLYEVQGHIVPFLVVVKVGKPSEVQK